jgi:oxygen-independent coproporphyrinogen-3 oxidase
MSPTFRPPARSPSTSPRASDPDARASLVDDGGVGVYVHLPFCERICPYCDFAIVKMRVLAPETERRYVDALIRELGARRADFEGRALASVYFGGGTPSLFRPESIRALVAAIRGAFPETAPGTSQAEIETTLELNPSTVERKRLPGFRAAGINRLSIGVQSFDDGFLRRLGRAHRAPVARETLVTAREAGFDNVSLDLIFAGREQTYEDLDRDLDEVIEWSPEHVSTYELTLEPETPFGRAYLAGKLAGCDEDLAAAMIGRIESRLESAGYERYEISSYARPGHRSRHNARYWLRQAVLGLGMGAHSTEARSPDHPHGARRANPRQLDAWVAAIEATPASAGELETLAPAVARGEAVFLALRRPEGLSAAAFEAEFGGAPRAFFAREIDAMVARGWLEESATGKGDLRLTGPGRMVADSVAAEFVAPARSDGSDEARSGPR